MESSPQKQPCCWGSWRSLRRVGKMPCWHGYVEFAHWARRSRRRGSTSLREPKKSGYQLSPARRPVTGDDTSRMSSFLSLLRFLVLYIEMPYEINKLQAVGMLFVKYMTTRSSKFTERVFIQYKRSYGTAVPFASLHWHYPPAALKQETVFRAPCVTENRRLGPRSPQAEIGRS